MRKIKFRGILKNYNSWIYGDLNQHPIHYDCQIIENGVINHSVEKESIGQFTGLLDKNGVEIYEGDIIEIDLLEYKNEFAEVAFENGAFGYILHSRFTIFYHMKSMNYFSIVGNIHQNPELLK